MGPTVTIGDEMQPSPGALPSGATTSAPEQAGPDGLAGPEPVTSEAGADADGECDDGEAGELPYV